MNLLRPVNGRRPLFFFALLLAVFLDTLGLGIITPLLPVYAEQLIGETASLGVLIGVLFAVHSIVRLVAMPYFGHLSDKLGRRKLFILIGLVIFIVSSFGYAFSTKYVHLLLSRLLQGFGSTMFYPIVLSYVGEMSPDGEEGYHMGPVNTAGFIGMGIGPLLGGLLTDLMEFKYVFFGMSALCMASFALIFLFVPESDRTVARRRRSDASLWRVFRSRVLGGVMLYRFLNAFLRGGQMSFLPLLAVSMFDMSYKEIGVVIACNTFLVGVLQTPFGWVADRLPKVPLIIIGNLLGALALMLIPVSGGFWGLLPLSVLIGIGSAMSITAAMAIAVQTGKGNRLMSSTMAVFSMAMSVGMVVAPMFTGIVLDLTGLGMIFPACGLLVIGGSFGVYALLRERGSKTEAD